MCNVIVLALVVPGCAQRVVQDDTEAAFRMRFQKGHELLTLAQEQSGADALAERSLLVDAREQFLRAALLQPGHIETARRITAMTRRLRKLEAVIAQQRVEEKQRRQRLAETIERLQKLTVRQRHLAQQSRRVLRRPPVLSGEEANLPDPSWAAEPLPPPEELNDLAAPISTEQRAVREAAAGVLDGITLQQETLRQLLTQAYGDTGRLPPTEVDPIVELLAGTLAAQDEAMANLAPPAVDWPRANTALHTAAGRMQQAVDALRSLQPPATDEQDDTTASRNVGDYSEDMEGLDYESQDNRSQPISAGDFKEALSLRSLPIPDYTSAEIMAEEAANQQKRARRKAMRAGAKVEKNW
jgi:hypothetical protein